MTDETPMIEMWTKTVSEIVAQLKGAVPKALRDELLHKMKSDGMHGGAGERKYEILIDTVTTTVPAQVAHFKGGCMHENCDEASAHTHSWVDETAQVYGVRVIHSGVQ